MVWLHGPVTAMVNQNSRGQRSLKTLADIHKSLSWCSLRLLWMAQTWLAKSVAGNTGLPKL